MLRAALSAGVAAVSAALCCLLLSLAMAVDRIPVLIEEQATAYRWAMRAEITATRVALVDEVRATRAMADRHLTEARGQLFGEIANLRTDALQRVDQALDIVDHRTAGVDAIAPALARVLARYEDLPDQVSAGLAPYTDCERNGLCWPGLVSDNLIAARTASRAVATSVPAAMRSIERASAAAADASEASAGVAQNLQRSTKPLPWWVRFVPIAGSASQVAIPFVIGGLR